MGNPGKAGPSLAWFIVPCILMIAALTLVGFGLSSFLHFARSDIRAYQPDSSILVSRDGFTLYTLDSAATGAADLQCTAGQPAGPGIRLRLQPISGRVTWSNGQGSFVAIASTPREVPPGRYVISCINTLGDTAVPLYLGPRVDLGAVARLVVFTVITPLFLGACSIVLFAILVILRYRSHRKPSPAGRPATPA